jgi:cytochrome P450
LKGANVLIMPWTVHRHRKLWDQPDAYIPVALSSGKPRQDRPLSIPAVRRRTTGVHRMAFAMQEAVIALATLMSRYRFDVTPETNPWPVQKLTTQPQGGLPMLVTARSGQLISAYPARPEKCSRHAWASARAGQQRGRSGPTVSQSRAGATAT